MNATDTNGFISDDTIRTLTESSYIVTSDIIVEYGVTPTIQLGVEVRFDGNFSLIVYGSLYADGTNAVK